MKNKLIAKLIPAAAAILIMVLSSCGSTELLAPSGLEAAEPERENPNRIKLSWLPVEGADIYYVYRSNSPAGEYKDYGGFSTTSANVENKAGVEALRYLYVENFTEGEGGTYYYKITAASDADINNESAMSSAVNAKTYDGTWKAAKELGAAAQLELAADISALYAVYSESGADSEITVQRYAEDDATETMNWSDAGSPGNTNGAVNNPFSVFIDGGELHIAFDDHQADTPGTVSMKYYHDSSTGDAAPSFSWELVGDAGFNDAAAAGLSGASIGFEGAIYSTFTEGAGPYPVELWKYNSTLDAWGERADSAPVDGALPTNAVNVSLVDFNNNAYLGYEDLTAPGLYLRVYDDGDQVLQNINSSSTITTVDIDDGNAVFVSSAGNLYAVYITAADEFEVEQFLDNLWVPLSFTAGKPVVTSASSDFGTLTAHWFNNALYVFYVDSSDNDGWVKYYDAQSGWLTAEKGGGAITDGGTITKVSLASSGNTLYAGYIEDGTAYVKTLE